MTIAWPHTLQPRVSGVHKRARTIAGSASLAGVSQIIASDAGLWVAELSEFPVVTPERIRLWRALEGQINGRANPVVVPICDMDRGPRPWGEATIPHSDETLFDDGTGYYGPAYLATANAAAAQRATTIQILTSSGNVDMPTAGHFFSMRQRLYSITAILSTAGYITTAKIFPPLREAISQGDGIDFGRPVCRMRLASDDAMDLTLDNQKRGFPSVMLIEDTSTP